MHTSSWTSYRNIVYNGKIINETLKCHFKKSLQRKYNIAIILLCYCNHMRYGIRYNTAFWNTIALLWYTLLNICIYVCIYSVCEKKAVADRIQTMADTVPNGTGDDNRRAEVQPEVATEIEGNQSEASPEVNGKQDTTPLLKCSPRYHTTTFPHKVKHGRAYASNMVSSQKMVVEHLRYVRMKLDREERQLNLMQTQFGYRKEINSMPDRHERVSPRYVDEEGE